MSGVPVLRGRRLALRQPRPGDRDDRLKCGRTDEYVLMCGGEPDLEHPFTAEDAEAWYRGITAEPYAWCIQAGETCIGSARLHSFRPSDRKARYAIGIFDSSAWSRGYGTEATGLVLAYAFETLGLHRIDLRVLAYNARALACYRKCGFVQEGVERESALISGAWYDDIMMSILDHEYRQLRVQHVIETAKAAGESGHHGAPQRSEPGVPRSEVCR